MVLKLGRQKYIPLRMGGVKIDLVRHALPLEYLARLDLPALLAVEMRHKIFKRVAARAELEKRAAKRVTCGDRARLLTQEREGTRIDFF